MGRVEVYYTDSNFNELGILKHEYMDIDIAGTMDFNLEFPIGKHLNLERNAMWFIDGTEYAGIIDKKEVITDNGIVRYNGRNLRGILNSKIIEPSAGEDYLILDGNISNIINKLLLQFGLDMFTCTVSADKIKSYQVPRYITLYELILKLCYLSEKMLSLTYHNKKVYISLVSRIDYTDYIINSKNSINFNIALSLNNVNHLICLGSGELKNRTVIHLYMSEDGKISTNPQHAGIYDYSQVYENTQAKDINELKSLGIQKLKELNNLDSVEAKVSNNLFFKIGDIVGGYEEITDIFVRREVTNIILQISNGVLQCTYSIGGEDTDASAVPYDDSDFYILPIATTTILGGIMIGDTLNIDDMTGTLNAYQFTNLVQKSKSLYNLSQ